VVAQGTDRDGAVRLAERLQRAIEATEVDGSPAFRMWRGYDAVDNYHDAPIEPSDMLVRATMAMRLSRSDNNGGGFGRLKHESTETVDGSW